MGKKRDRERSKRKKSSESDLEGRSNKQVKRNGKTGKSENVSDVIGEANSILYDQENNYDLDRKSDSESESQSSINTSVFSTQTDLNTNPSMASGSSPVPTTALSDSKKLDSILSGMSTVTANIEELKNGQEGMKRMITSKIDKLRNELVENIDSKVKTLHDDLNSEIGEQSKRMNDMMETMKSLQDRLSTVELAQRSAPTGAAADHSWEGAADDMETTNAGNRFRFRPGHLDDSDISIMASGVTYEDGEDLLRKAQDIINALSNNVSEQVAITRVIRIRSRFRDLNRPDRPPLVKICFRNLDEKVLVLRNKMSLKETQNYKTVYLQSTKSHAERLIELNARMLLRQMPGGNNFRVNANGRIQQRTRQDNGDRN